MYSKWILGKRVALFRLYILVESKRHDGYADVFCSFGLDGYNQWTVRGKHEKFGPEIGHKNTAHYILFVSQLWETWRPVEVSIWHPTGFFVGLTQNMYLLLLLLLVVVVVVVVVVVAAAAAVAATIIILNSVDD